MDSFEKIKELKAEYKNYLTEQHPDWADSSVNTHVSDAFYIWNNSVLPGFFKVFQSEESMEFARTAILDHLKAEVKSPNYEARTKGYFKDLQMLKAFLDNEFGGIEKRIGEEFTAEEVIYDIAKRCYSGTLAKDNALDELVSRVPNFSRTSHKMMLDLFVSMIEGRKYSRRGNAEITICFIRNIGKDFGAEKMLNALKSTWDNIIYYYGKTGNKSTCMRKSCQQIVETNNFTISLVTALSPPRIWNFASFNVARY